MGLETEVFNVRKRLLQNVRGKDLIISSDSDGNNCVDITESESALQQLLESLEYRRVFIHGITSRSYWQIHGKARLVKNTAFLKMAKYLPGSSPKDFILRQVGVKLGKDTNIGMNVHLDPLYPNLIAIGDSVVIGYDAIVSTHFHGTNGRNNYFCFGEVAIEPYGMIGARSIIGPGIRVGMHATVAPNSVPYTDVEPYSTVIGNPARRLR